MAESDSIDALSKIVDALKPLSSEGRARLIRAAMVLLGDAADSNESDNSSSNIGPLPPRVKTWMRQNSVSSDELQQVFHLSDGGADVIAVQMPGRNKKDQTRNAYVLYGLAQFLITGNLSFDDKGARSLCESSGCYDLANHSATLKNRGNEFAGSKDKGWTLTAPGLTKGAEIIKDLAKLNS